MPRRLRIQTRLSLAFGIILVMTALLVLLGGFGLRVSQQALQGITRKLILTSNITFDLSQRTEQTASHLQQAAVTARQLAGATAATMNDIVGSAQRVTDISGEISAAAQEQSRPRGRCAAVRPGARSGR